MCIRLVDIDLTVQRTGEYGQYQQDQTVEKPIDRLVEPMSITANMVGTDHPPSHFSGHYYLVWK